MELIYAFSGEVSEGFLEFTRIIEKIGERSMRLIIMGFYKDGSAFQGYSGRVS